MQREHDTTLSAAKCTCQKDNVLVAKKFGHEEVKHEATSQSVIFC